MSSSDVVIVGGGPAGLFAGMGLARAGYQVDLFEEHRDVGMPVHCTGVLAREAFDTFGLAPASVLNELTTVRFVAPSGETVEYSTPTVEAVVIDRVQFDRQLAAQAQFAGVRVHQARVTALNVEAGRRRRSGGRLDDSGAGLPSGVRCQLHAAASARVGHPPRDAQLGADGAPLRASWTGRGALWRRRGVGRLRLGCSRRSARPPPCARGRDVRRRCRAELPPHARDGSTPLGGANGR